MARKQIQVDFSCPLARTWVLPTQLPQIAVAPEAAPVQQSSHAELLKAELQEAEPAKKPNTSLKMEPAALQAREPEPAVAEAIPEMRGLVSLKTEFGPPATKPITPVILNVATIPQPLRTEAIRPSSGLEPLDAKPVSDLMQPEAGEAPAIPGIALKTHVWDRAAGFWKLAPRDLKILAFAIPVLLALAAHRQLPKVRFANHGALHGRASHQPFGTW